MNDRQIIAILASLLFSFLALFIYWQNNRFCQNINVQLAKNNVFDQEEDDQEDDDQEETIISEEEEEIIKSQNIFVDNYLIQFGFFFVYCFFYGKFYNGIADYFIFGKYKGEKSFWEETKEYIVDRFFVNLKLFFIIVVVIGELIISSIIYFFAYLIDQQPLKYVFSHRFYFRSWSKFFSFLISLLVLPSAILFLLIAFDYWGIFKK